MPKGWGQARWGQGTKVYQLPHDLKTGRGRGSYHESNQEEY